MKRLTLIRHAKSSHDDPRLPDHARTLNARGRRDAPAMGLHLRDTFGFSPDIMVSSTATRTTTTARLLTDAIGGAWLMEQDARIYEAPVPSLVAVLHDQDDAHSHVCLVGHNPGMENLANWLCGARVVQDVVTCAVIMLELDIRSWASADMGTAKLREYLYPALIGQGNDGD